MVKATGFRSAFVILGLAAAGLASTATGCGDGLNDCEEARAQINARIELCTKDRVVDNPPDFNRVECTDAAGTVALCQAAVFNETSCDCIDAHFDRCSPGEALIFSASFNACK